MPNRIIKESIWTSPNLAKLSPRAELHFYRLLPVPDDFGCFESTASVIRGRCYPLNESIRSTDIEKWQEELDQNDLIVRWESHGRQFAIFPTWERHQRIRSTHQRKTPEPPLSVVERCQQIRSNGDDYGQLMSNDGKCQQVTAIDDLNPNPNPNPNPIKEKTIEKENPYKEYAMGLALSEKEFNSLMQKYGYASESQIDERVEDVIHWAKAHGKKVHSLYDTILNWDRLEAKRSRQTEKTGQVLPKI